MATHQPQSPLRLWNTCTWQTKTLRFHSVLANSSIFSASKVQPGPSGCISRMWNTKPWGRWDGGPALCLLMTWMRSYKGIFNSCQAKVLTYLCNAAITKKKKKQNIYIHIYLWVKMIWISSLASHCKAPPAPQHVKVSPPTGTRMQYQILDTRYLHSTLFLSSFFFCYICVSWSIIKCFMAFIKDLFFSRLSARASLQFCEGLQNDWEVVQAHHAHE